MKCPKCGWDTEVIDSRPTDKFENSRKRRRECLKCVFRFNTYELIIKTEEGLRIPRGEKEK